MRINVIIPKEKMIFWSFLTNPPNLPYEEIYGDKCGELFCMWILGLKGWCWAKLLRQHKKETLGPTWDFFLEDVPSVIGVV